MIDILAAIGIICVGHLLISTIRNGRKKPKQTCFIYCPRCRNELISSDSFVEDRDGFIKYKCTKCGNISFWDFIHYPAPFLKTCAEDCKHGYLDELGCLRCDYLGDCECDPDTMVKFEQKWKGSVYD